MSSWVHYIIALISWQLSPILGQGSLGAARFSDKGRIGAELETVAQFYQSHHYRAMFQVPILRVYVAGFLEFL